MNKYELMYILSCDSTDEQREALIEKYKAFVEAKGGVVNGLDKLGMKKFAYAINYKTEGFYVLMNFEAPSDVVSELTKQMNIADLVVRQMFVRK
ncbi:MAG: 30S ribosomal protein S6 [Clostridia bacterium]|nr:30S ribosomal protein S6 [Clostridia bacterium]